MNDKINSKITSVPEGDIKAGDTKRWKPSKKGSTLTITLVESSTPDTVELTPSAEEGIRTTPQTGKDAIDNLDKIRFTVEYKKKDSKTFVPYDNSKVSSNSLL